MNVKTEFRKLTDLEALKKIQELRTDPPKVLPALFIKGMADALEAALVERCDAQLALFNIGV